PAREGLSQCARPSALHFSPVGASPRYSPSPASPRCASLRCGRRLRRISHRYPHGPLSGGWVARLRNPSINNFCDSPFAGLLHELDDDASGEVAARRSTGTFSRAATAHASRCEELSGRIYPPREFEPESNRRSRLARRGTRVPLVRWKRAAPNIHG